MAKERQEHAANPQLNVEGFSVVLTDVVGYLATKPEEYRQSVDVFIQAVLVQLLNDEVMTTKLLQDTARGSQLMHESADFQSIGERYALLFKVYSENIEAYAAGSTQQQDMTLRGLIEFNNQLPFEDQYLLDILISKYIARIVSVAYGHESTTTTLITNAILAIVTSHTSLDDRASRLVAQHISRCFMDMKGWDRVAVARTSKYSRYTTDNQNRLDKQRNIEFRKYATELERLNGPLLKLREASEMLGISTSSMLHLINYVDGFSGRVVVIVQQNVPDKGARILRRFLFIKKHVEMLIEFYQRSSEVLTPKIVREWLATEGKKVKVRYPKKEEAPTQLL